MKYVYFLMAFIYLSTSLHMYVLVLKQYRQRQAWDKYNYQWNKIHLLNDGRLNDKQWIELDNLLLDTRVDA